MAFPGKILSPQQLQKLRKWLIQKIYSVPSNLSPESNTYQLDKIARTLGRLAGNESTAYETGAVRTSATTSASLLEQQVERAITQVLGRAPGRGTDGFMSALTGAFPADASGRVSFVPSRSMVSLYSPNGTGNASIVSVAEGSRLTGQISVEQANLYRVGTIIATDTLRVLEGLKPFDPRADLDAVEALRSLIRSQINSLVEEFGRLDEPREQRVESYLYSLLLYLLQFGIEAFAPGLKELVDLMEDVASNVAYRSGRRMRRFTIVSQRVNQFQSVLRAFVRPVNVDDEAQIAGYELLLNYLIGLMLIWVQFEATTPAEIVSQSYSERLSRASLMLPVIAGSNDSLMAAMDSIGFTESERRSRTAQFSELEGGQLQIPCVNCDQTGWSQGVAQPVRYFLPTITVNDFNDWIDRLTNFEAPSILATSGRYGLDFVADQADTLFWTIGLVLYYITCDAGQSSSLYLKEVLSYERVQQSLRELISHLKELADQALPEPKHTETVAR